MKKEIKSIQKSKVCDLFTLVRNDQKKWVVVLGDYQATHMTFDSLQKAEEYIAAKPYKLLFNSFQILQHYAEKNKETAKETAKNAEAN